MQIYLYIGLAIAVYVISVIKTYGLGYDRGFKAGMDVHSDDKWWGKDELEATKKALTANPPRNSQPEDNPFLEDTNYQPGDNPEYFR
jgi:hypothetical protein